ncbi:MAG: GyrI-like domain-containing protein [Candidatus Hodarchaeales archaeon]|jgi:effector-binding domain-containing protein
MPQPLNITHVIRDETLFASIRQPVKELGPVKELLPLIEKLNQGCQGHIEGPLRLLFHFDTLVDGYDAEIGYPVNKQIEHKGISTRTLPYAEFLSITHRGPYQNLQDTYAEVYGYMHKNGLSSALEIEEILHNYNFEDQEECITDVHASFLMWDKLYNDHLEEILGEKKRKIVWGDGDKITPFTSIEERVGWVKETLDRLKEHATDYQQFEIISRLALPRPLDEIDQYKEIYEETGDIHQVLEKREGTQNWKIKPKFENNIIYASKIPYFYFRQDREAYDNAKTPAEIRATYCFCTLIRNYKGDTGIDPIFCYRAAGWEKQLWERVFGKKVVKGEILKSVLSGDEYCQFALHFPPI